MLYDDAGQYGTGDLSILTREGMGAPVRTELNT